MATEPLLDALRAELGEEERGLNFLSALPAAAQARLAQDLHAARVRQRDALNAAINNGMRMVPALLRGPLKKILFT